VVKVAIAILVSAFLIASCAFIPAQRVMPVDEGPVATIENPNVVNLEPR